LLKIPPSYLLVINIVFYCYQFGSHYPGGAAGGIWIAVIVISFSANVLALWFAVTWNFLNKGRTTIDPTTHQSTTDSSYFGKVHQVFFVTPTLLQMVGKLFLIGTLQIDLIVCLNSSDGLEHLGTNLAAELSLLSYAGFALTVAVSLVRQCPFCGRG